MATLAAREQEIAEEYASSLSDLNFNSKPLINMLTMLADEYRNHASVIVSTVEQHLLKVRTEVKLPVLYLIDSIVKNVGVRYTQLFKQNIASLFCGVFEKVDEKVRANMFKLRCTWGGVFPDDCLQQLDIGVNKIDRAWPIVAVADSPAVTATAPAADSTIRETLLKKQKELLELQHKRLELELLQTKARLLEQQRQLEQQNAQAKADAVKDVKATLPQLKEDVTKLLSSPNPDPEEAKKLKTKLAELSSIAANQHAATSATAGEDAATADSKSSRSSTGKTKQAKPTAAVTPSVPVTKPAGPFVNPFVKHNTTSSAPSEITPASSSRVCINPVSSDLVTAVAVRRTASAAAVRDPRLRRSDLPETSAPPPAPVATTFTVTISEPPVLDKKKQRERKSSSHDELFGDSYHKKSPRSASKSSLDDKRERRSDRMSDRDPRSRKSSKQSSSDTEKRSQDSDISRSPRYQSPRKTPEKTKLKSDESRARSSESSTTSPSAAKKKDKQPDKPPLLKPHQLPPIPKVKSRKTPNETPLPPVLSNSKISEEVPSKIVDQSNSKSTNKKDSTEDKNSAERRKQSNSKVLKPSEQLSSLEETIRLKKQQIEDELKANAKNLHELNERINEKEKYNDKEKYSGKEKSDKYIEKDRYSDKEKYLEEDEGKGNSFDSTSDISNVDDIIRLRKSDTSSLTMNIDHSKSDIDDIIRMRKQEKRIDTLQSKTENQYKERTKKDLSVRDSSDCLKDMKKQGKKTNQEQAKTLNPNEEISKKSPAITRETPLDHSNQLKEKSVDMIYTPPHQANDVTNAPAAVEEPTRPRLFIKNIALLTKPVTPPPSQELDEISEDELQEERTIPITGLLEDDSEDETLSDEDHSLLNSEGKFKELKPSSLKRLRQFVRSRDQLTPSPPPPPSVKELTAALSTGDPSQQNDLAQITTGDVDLRPLLLSTSTEEPPSKKSKPEGALDLFGFGLQDVDLRNPQASGTGRAKIPSPPPPPIISTGSDEQSSGGGKLEKRRLRVKPYSQLERNFDISPEDSRKNYDTDMRHIATPTRNVKAIVKQAEIDLKNGSITFIDYSNILRRSLQPVPMSTPMPMLPAPPPGLLAHPMLPQMPPLLPFPGHLVRPGAFPMPPMLPPGLGPPPPGISAPGLPPFMPRPPVANFSSFGGLQPADPEVLASIMRDQMKSINIDSVARPIRFYGHTGIVFLAWDDPREIGFVKGVRKITFDGTETVICSLNAPYKDFMLNGVKHRIRLGNPTRELYIDDNFYECCFGGPPLCVDIGGTSHLVQLEGPPPTVTIDTKKRTDLCAGKVDLYIDDSIHVPMFLDCKPHKVDVDGYPYILRFVEALRLLVINGSPFKINFGGTPVMIALHDKNHSFAFSPLPPGVRQGYVDIAHMDGGRLPSPPPLKPKPAVISAPPRLEENSQESEGAVALGKSDEGIPFLNSGEINITDLFAKLVALGALPASASTQPAEDTTRLKPVSWHSASALATRQPAMIHSLYSGIQCGSCGARFPPDHTAKYSLHLDWHFRLNRRERDLGRSVQSRKFYYSAREWTAYYEIEDDDNKGQSWFEMQEAGGEGRGMTGGDESQPSEEMLASCAAELNEVEPRCGVCRDRFEQFYNEEKEEWQLRRAVRVEGVAYHPVCYRDHLAFLEAKQKEDPTGVEESFADSEEGPVPEDAEEFTRQIPVGVYTIADDNEEERDMSVQVIEQYTPDDALLKMETESDLNAISNLKEEFLDESSKLVQDSVDRSVFPDENKHLTEALGESKIPPEVLEDSNIPSEVVGDNSNPPALVQDSSKAEVPLENSNDPSVPLENSPVPSPIHEEGDSALDFMPVKEESVLLAVKEEAMQVDETQADLKESNSEEVPQETKVSEETADAEMDTELPPSDNPEEVLDQDNETSEKANENFELEENIEKQEIKVKQEIEDVLEDVKPNTVTDLDGNIQDKTNVNKTQPAHKKIRINITKTVLPGNIVKAIEPVTIDEKSSSPKPVEMLDDAKEKENNDLSDPNQPKTVKPLIASKKMTAYPPLNKGKELSALCSIM